MVAAQAEGHIHQVRHRPFPLPAPGDRPVAAAVLPQAELEVAAAQLPLLQHLAAGTPEHRCGESSSQRFEPLQLVPEGPVDPIEAEQGLRLHRDAAGLAGQPVCGQGIEGSVQGRHILGPHREATGGGMAAMALQQRFAVAQGLVHGKTTGSPHRRAQAPVAFAGQQGHRQAEALHQPGCHHSDHPVMPVPLGQQQER